MSSLSSNKKSLVCVLINRREETHRLPRSEAPLHLSITEVTLGRRGRGRLNKCGSSWKLGMVRGRAVEYERQTDRQTVLRIDIETSFSLLPDHQS